MKIALADCELQYDYIDTNHYAAWKSNYKAMLEFARACVNPWQIVRPDGVVIASSYDGFTAAEQAAANGRTS